LRDRAFGGHVLRLGVKLPVRFQVEIGDRDLGAEPGQPFGVGTPEPARRAGDDRNLAVELAPSASLPITETRYSAATDIESGSAGKFRRRPVFALIYSGLSAADPSVRAEGCRGNGRILA